MDEDDGVPRGVLPAPGSRKRGWDGGHLEMEHQVESLRQNKSSAVAAVDVRQFHNVEVGEGYKARHVVRQPSAARRDAAPSKKSRDATSGGSSSCADGDAAGAPAAAARDVEKLLRNDGLRAFRREIEKILSSEGS